MRLGKSKSRNAISYYVINDIVKNGKRTTEVIEKLGTHAELLQKLGGEDPEIWARNYIDKLNRAADKDKVTVTEKYSNDTIIDKDVGSLYSAGHLFIECLLSELGILKELKKISKKYSFKYNLVDIFSKLVCARFLDPSSKRSSLEFCKSFLDSPDFSIHHIYRALSVLSTESELLQQVAYKNSHSILKRNDSILYYDVTNYYFEITEADGIKQYGFSKEHRPSPIVNMGLFLDGSGIPLAFSIFDGNSNEQPSLKPLERRVIKDFELSNIVVCTDAGLSSNENRKFNTFLGRNFITTQSVKKLKVYLEEWALNENGWRLVGSDKIYTLSQIKNMDDQYVFYKERWINDDNLEQRLVISYSLKYAKFQSNIRLNQLNRAIKKAESGSNLKKKTPNDPDRFIEVLNYTSDGEVCDKTSLSINYEVFDKESKYDGFYAICTSLDWEIEKIIEINKQRWQIERAFRLLKTEFKSRPVYLKREDRIHAHFTICYFALLVLKIMEKKLNADVSSEKLIDTLRNMYLFDLNGKGYTPAFTRTDLTDRLHEVFGFRLDTKLIDLKTLNNVLKSIKK